MSDPLRADGLPQEVLADPLNTLEARGPATGDAAPAAAPLPPSLLSASLAGLGAGVLQRKLAQRIQRRAAADGGGADEAQVHDLAATGVAGGGGSLPHLDRIQASFGGHDVSGVRAHTDSAAAQASASIGAVAYATGNDVAFAGAPDLHTAAHEAAHVVQQRAGVQLSGGVGQEGDAYERHADAVADAVVRGESAQGLLSHGATGTGGAGQAVQGKAVQLLGTPLDQKPPADEPVPAYGEDKGQQRRFSPDQYIAMWEKEQGKKLTPDEKDTIARGCIGLTAQNLQGGGNPLDSAEKVYGGFDQAHAAMVAKNQFLDSVARIPLLGSLFAGKARYVVFAKLFWSNQSEDWNERLKPDDKAFKPDPKTGEVDMTGYKYHAQSRWKKDKKTGQMKKSSYVNFDYGFWDEASQSFWHANHMDYHDPDDPMEVYQSTKDKFTKGYIDFDRIVFAVALAENYNPGLAAIKHAGGGH